MSLILDTDILKDSAYRYLRDMLNNIADPIFVKDSKHRWIDGNKAFWELMGGPPHRFIGKSDYDFFSKEEADIFWEKDNQVFSTGQPVISEEYLTDQAGKRHIISTKKALFQNENGEKVLVGVIRDITAQKELEKIASERIVEKRFRSMADTVPALLWMSDIDRHFVFFNRSWLQFTGRAMHQEIGNGWTEGIHPDDAHQFRKTYTSAFGQRTAFKAQFRLRRHDGNYIWFNCLGEPRFAEDGSFAGYSGACMDVHEQMLARNKIEENESYLRFALKASGMGSWKWDAATDVVALSERSKEIFSLPPDASLTREELLIMLPEEDRIRAVAAFHHAVQNVADYQVEYRINRLDGKQCWVSVRGQCLYNAGHTVIGMTGLMQDITDRKVAEELAHNSLKAAQDASIAKSEFLANMSHEIRTPMNAVVGLAEILDHSRPLTDNQREYIKTLKLSAQSLLALINDLLDIAKIESNSIDLEHIPFNLRELIDDLISVCRIRASEKNIELTLLPDNAGETFFLGDPQRIRQILMNLFSNAIKFTHNGGVKIQITHSPCSMPQHRYIHVSVQDSGIGIPQHMQESIFDKFAQADTSVTRQYGGTGLGLAISKNLAEIMNGSITVNSVPDEGAEFTLHLPLEIAQHQLYALPPSPREPTTTRSLYIPAQNRLLLVEDNSSNILVAQHLIEHLGYSCDIARNGIEGLQLLRQSRRHYAAVLMDVQMPEMDGYTATRLIREEEKEFNLPHMPIIGVTAHALTGDRDKCIEAGMDDYISKPFHAEQLKIKLDKLLLTDEAKELIA